jgi:hypothetical protein
MKPLAAPLLVTAALLGLTGGLHAAGARNVSVRVDSPLPPPRWARLDARLRYFDPERRRAGVPPDVAALVSEMTDTKAVVTLVNLSKSQPRTVVVQGGAYGEHQLESVTAGGKTTRVQAPLLTVRLGPGCGQRLVLRMRRYANRPTALHPWHREGWQPPR